MGVQSFTEPVLFSIWTQMLQLWLSQQQMHRHFADCVLTDEAKKSAVYYLNGEIRGREMGSGSKGVRSTYLGPCSFTAEIQATDHTLYTH